MEELVINGKIVSFNNPNQVINMGGPWVGKLLLDNNEITDNVVLENIFYNKAQNNLYFIKYHEISKWQKENYFSINILDLQTNNLFMYDLKFRQVYIEKIDKDDLIYYEAFHNKDESKKSILNVKELKYSSVPPRLL
jgi:hypothetical protein